MADQDPSFVWPDAIADPRLDAIAPVLQQLRSEASTIDTTAVTREHIDRLRDVGYFALTCPPIDAQPPAPALAREAVERCAAASGAVWLVTTQHRSPLEAVRSTSNEDLRERYLSGLSDATLLGAVAFAHIRRGGRPSVLAERDGSGWRVNGRLDWLTSWGLADVLLLLAQTDDGQVVSMVLPARERPGLVVRGSVDLAAMSATSTVRVELTDLLVSDEEVVRIVDREGWLAADALRTVNSSPAVFGLLRAVTGDLDALGERRQLPELRDAASTFAAAGVSLRSRAYELIDSEPAESHLDERLAIRAEAAQLAVRASAARVAAEGGAAMRLASPAQRWAREALFALVQAQTQPLKFALVKGFAGGG